MCRFYGWGLEYVEQMDLEDFKTMLLAEEVLSNRETLAQLRCSDFPTLKNEERQRFHKEVFKKAYPNLKAKVISFDDLEGIFNG